MEHATVLSGGVGPSGDHWQLRHRRTADDGDDLSLCVDGDESYGTSGLQVPRERDFEWSAGMEEGGDFYLFGLTSVRVAKVIAEGPGQRLEVSTEPFPHHVQRSDVRFFAVAVRPLHLTSIAAVDGQGNVLQRDPVVQ